MATPDTAGEPGHIIPFGNVLAALQGGTTHTELSRELHNLTAIVLELGKKGTLTLTLNVVPSKEYGRVELHDKVTVKEPERDRYASIFFVDDDGNLTRTDPRQLAFDLGPRSVDKAN